MKTYEVRGDIPKEVNESLMAYPELVRKLLYYRGVDAAEKAHIYMNPDYSALHDPFLLNDMDRAVERILKAIKNQEKILIYSDYDADGIPAAVVMHDFFKSIGYENFDIYIPHRHNEGYGLHLEAVDKFSEQGVKLLITLDCGIVDHAEVSHAMKYGIDVIVTDHHEPGESLPEAFAVVNPKRKDSTYPEQILCGSGVAFKLVQALYETLGRQPGEAHSVSQSKIRAFHPSASTPLKVGQEKWLLDMVGLATLSDMVPLHGENRILAHYGLKVLRKTRRPGLGKLLELMKMKRENITEDDVGFMITPRINAASRMGVPTDAFKMLSETDEVQGDLYAKHLDTINKERKVLVATLTKEIKKVLAEREDHFKDKKIIVLGNPAWRPALLGLAANKVVETHGRPVFLWGKEDGKFIKGSCRSDGVANVVAIMTAAKHALLDFGGHKMSGGFSVESEKIHHLEDALCAACESLPQSEGEVEPEYIDAKLELRDLTWDLFNTIDKLAPFGVGNSKPQFLFENIVPVEVKLFGKTKEHLELSFKNFNGRIIKAIAFFMTPEDFSKPLTVGVPINLVATIEKSTFGYTPELRLRIVDVL